MSELRAELEAREQAELGRRSQGRLEDGRRIVVAELLESRRDPRSPVTTIVAISP